MKNDLKKALDEQGLNLFGLDDEFEFSCKQCGKCCINREDIILSARDVYRISRALSMKPHEMIKEYGDVYIGEKSGALIVRLLPRGTVKRCRFLENRRCSIHNAKPTVCATYPVGRCVGAQRLADGSVSNEGFETHYFLNKVHCNAGSETYTVRQWLDMFGISTEDTFFVMWQRAIVEISLLMEKHEKKLKKETMTEIWNAIFVLLYLNYDMDKEFMPQFEENLGNVMCMLDQLPAEIKKIRKEVRADARRMKECKKEPQNA